MTHLLTRLYADEKTANAVQDRLLLAGFPRHTMRVFTLRDGEDRDGAMRRISAVRVPERAASVYAENVAAGNVLLTVTADYKPLGARKIGLKILAASDAMPTNLEEQDFKLAWVKDHAPSIMKDHPRLMTGEPHYGAPRASFSAQFGFGTLSTKERRNKVGKGGPVLPFGTLKTGRNANSAMSGGRHMSRMFWPMSLLSKGERRPSVIKGGGTPFSRLFGLRTISD